jgi:hypothetical protein
MIDYSIWDMLDTFTPECAALLWLEIEPRDDCLEDIKVTLHPGALYDGNRVPSKNIEEKALKLKGELFS